MPFKVIYACTLYINPSIPPPSPRLKKRIRKGFHNAFHNRCAVADVSYVAAINPRLVDPCPERCLPLLASDPGPPVLYVEVYTRSGGVGGSWGICTLDTFSEDKLRVDSPATRGIGRGREARGHSGTKWLPTAKRPRGVEAVNAKI